MMALKRFGCPLCGDIVAVGRPDGSTVKECKCYNCHIPCILLNTEKEEEYFKRIRNDINDKIDKIRVDLFRRIWEDVPR
jgi:hypothetical protein